MTKQCKALDALEQCLPHLDSESVQNLWEDVNRQIANGRIGRELEGSGHNAYLASRMIWLQMKVRGLR